MVKGQRRIGVNHALNTGSPDGCNLGHKVDVEHAVPHSTTRRSASTIKPKSKNVEYDEDQDWEPCRNGVNSDSTSATPRSMRQLKVERARARDLNLRNLKQDRVHQMDTCSQ